MEDDGLEALIELLLGGPGSGPRADAYMPLYGKATLGGMMPTRGLQHPEIPAVDMSALGEPVGSQQAPPTNQMDPYMLYLLGMGGMGPGGQGPPVPPGMGGGMDPF